MANIKTGSYHAQAALPKGENRLPRFRDPKHDTIVYSDPDIPEKYTRLMGLDCGMRVLPYTMQDQYDRDSKETDIPAIIMENDRLRATFLPSLGGRLMSLVDLSDGRELVYNNTKLQVANLANRNAWFSGGIEWNIGQYGHAFSSCTDIFASIQTDKNGEDFLRLYDYERCKQLWWHMDFHLPQGSSMLYANMTVHNLNSKRNSFYYWTNTAVEMTEGTRIFASSDKAVYLDPYSPLAYRKYGFMQMPTIPIYPEIDASYPIRFPYSEEYFFTCDEDDMPWETALEKDGRGFFEVSTHPLSYRKMFCWGWHPGGTHWQEFLAPGLGKQYVEIQGGVAPSQQHGMFIEGNSSISWTQAFGCLSTDSSKVTGTEYPIAKLETARCVQERINAKQLETIHQELSASAQIPPQKVVHIGSGWGYLKQLQENLALPAAFNFPISSVTEKEQPWLDFLKQGTMECSTDAFSHNAVVDTQWRHALQAAISTCSDNKQRAVMNHYLGIAALEHEEVVTAKQCWLDAFAAVPNAWTARNLAMLELRRGRKEEALQWYQTAMEQSGSDYLPMIEEYFKLLVESDHKQEALKYYEEVAKHHLQTSDCIALDRAMLAASLGDAKTIKELVIDRDLANIREGDLLLNNLWDAYCELEFKERRPLPQKLDFNLFNPEIKRS